MTLRRLCALSAAAALTCVLTASPPASAETAVSCPSSPAAITIAQADRVWDIAAARLDALAGPATFPFGATGRSRYLRTSAYAWTSGFYPTSLWLMYERTRSAAWLTRARDYTSRLLPVARWRGTHDLGFMIGGPTTLGIRLDPSTDRGLAYAEGLRTASQSLATRWNARVGAIRSAYYGDRWGLIVDSAMNAPMLIATGLVYGGVEGRRLAARGREHMRTLAENFIRPDGSTFHRLSFDPRTGALLGPIYGQGLSTRSTWSRGQAWAINGFARAVQLTGDPKLLDAARRTADHWIARVPAGCVPAWDLDVSSAGAPRDSSAAAIVTDGLLTLALIDPDASRAATYRQYALTTLGTLARPRWVPDRGRGLLSEQSYNIPADGREGTYSWGDAYLLHALAAAASYSG